HTTTARDIGVMSRELITKYPQIHQYSTIWMENITHTTKKGTTEFGLTNTNKLLRQYQYATGLKTGSTSQAKYCVSATAKKDGMELIAVIMAAPDYKIRFKDATTLLNYGFGKCVKYEDANKEQLDEMEVRHGIQKTVKIEAKVPFSYIDITGADLSAVKKKTVLSKGIQAPVKKGAVVGEIQYALNDKKIGAVDIITRSEVKAMTYASAFSDILTCFLL
ncbi:MAG: D-alanyl-D-alanine carboxypeptidase, partial [Lachnospiraceae bacterium]